MINEAGNIIVSQDTVAGTSSVRVSYLASGSVVDLAASALQLKLYPGRNNYFAIAEQVSAGVMEIKAYNFKAPESALSTIYIDSAGERFEGEPEPWQNLPRTYFLQTQGLHPLVRDPIVLVSTESRRATTRTFPAHDELKADFKGVDEVVDSLDGPLVITSVDGGIFFVDPCTWKVIAEWKTEGEASGAGKVAYRRSSREFWVADTEGLTSYQKSLWGKWKPSRRLKTRFTSERAELFAPERAFFSCNEAYFAMLRPGRDEAIIVDCESFEVKERVQVPHRKVSQVELRSDGTLVDIPVDPLRTRMGSTSQIAQGRLGAYPSPSLRLI